MKALNIILISSLILLFGCSKESNRNEDTTTNSSIDYAFGQSAVYDAFKIVHQAANSSKGIALVNMVDATSLFGCDTLIIDTIANPMSITIQFNGTCSGNSIDRIGSITATFSSKYDVLGCTIDISFNNYTYKGYPITGAASYLYTGLNLTAPTYSYTANDIKVTSGSKFMYWSGNQSVTVSSGETTATVIDDSYTLSGAAYGSTYAGNEFSATIDTDLTLLGSCEWISSGIVSVTPENKDPRVLDFGSGCDDKAIVKIYSKEEETVIP